MDKNKLKAIVSVLKKRFNNLGAEDLLDLAMSVLEAVEASQQARYHAHTIGAIGWVQCTSDICTVNKEVYQNLGPKLLCVPPTID